MAYCASAIGTRGVGPGKGKNKTLGKMRTGALVAHLNQGRVEWGHSVGDAVLTLVSRAAAI